VDLQMHAQTDGRCQKQYLLTACMQVIICVDMMCAGAFVIVAASTHRLGFSGVLSSWPRIQRQSGVTVLQGT